MVRALHRSVTKLLMAVLAVAFVAAASAIASPLKNTQNRDVGSVLAWQNGHYMINGKKIFLVTTVTSYCLSPNQIDRAIAIGINVFQSYSATCHYDLHQVLNGRAFWIDLATGGDPNTSEGLPELLTTAPGLRTGGTHGPLKTTAGDTIAYSKCQQDSTAPMYNQAMSLKGPSLYGIRVQNQISPSWTNCVDASHFQADFWTAIAARTGGILYDLQSSDGSQDPPLFDPAPGLEAQAQKFKQKFDQIKQCVMNGTRVEATANRRAIGVAAWKYNGTMCVVAVNMTSSSTGATFSLPANGSPRAVQALGEARGLKVASGKFADHFGELKAHVYRSR